MWKEALDRAVATAASSSSSSSTNNDTAAVASAAAAAPNARDSARSGRVATRSGGPGTALAEMEIDTDGGIHRLSPTSQLRTISPPPLSYMPHADRLQMHDDIAIQAGHTKEQLRRHPEVHRQGYGFAGPRSCERRTTHL